jgi:hypothetical protein
MLLWEHPSFRENFRCAKAAGLGSFVGSTRPGVLAAVVDSDFPDEPDSLSGRFAIYTSGRFLWPQVRTANPSFVFDPVSINILKAKGITFEAVATGFGNHWIRES